jgi:hypothetical protein
VRKIDLEGNNIKYIVLNFNTLEPEGSSIRKSVSSKKDAATLKKIAKTKKGASNLKSALTLFKSSTL